MFALAVGHAQGKAEEGSMQNFLLLKESSAVVGAALDPQDGHDIRLVSRSEGLTRVCPILCFELLAVPCLDAPMHRPARIDVRAMPTLCCARRTNASPFTSNSEALGIIEEHLCEAADF